MPKHIRSDNGPEFIAQAIQRHGEAAGLKMLYIEPGSPWENGCAESFFSRLPDELLNVEELENLAEARWLAARHQQKHNEERPHSTLGYQTPSEFAELKQPHPLPNLNSRSPWRRKWGHLSTIAGGLGAFQHA